MKGLKISIGLLSIFGALAFAAPVLAATVEMACDPDDINASCTASLWVSSGTGAGQVMKLRSANAPNFIISVPNEVDPPPPGHANTIQTGQVSAYLQNAGTAPIIYNVVQNGKTIDTCTFNVNVALPDAYLSKKLSITGSCENQFAAPVNVENDNTLDIGIN